MKKKSGAVAARRGPGLWLQGLVCGGLVTLAPSTALLAGVLLLPSIIIYLMDTTEGRPVLRTVLLFGFAGSLKPLIALWSDGHSMDASLALLADIAAPAIAWSAQGAGWLLTQLIPLLVRITLEAQARVEVARLRARRDEVAEQWGLPPADGAEDVSAEPARTR